MADISCTSKMSDEPEEMMASCSDLEEYETQYFGFTRKSFCDGVYNAVNQYLMECLKALKDFMSQEFTGFVTEEQLESGINNMIPVFVHNFDKTVDKLELYLLNIFQIPKHVLLPEDAAQLTPYSKEEEVALDKEIQELHQCIMAVKYANVKMRQELYDLEEAQAFLNNTLQKLEELQNCFVGSDVHLYDNLVYAKERIGKSMKFIRKLKSDMSENQKVKEPQQLQIILRKVKF